MQNNKRFVNKKFGELKEKYASPFETGELKIVDSFYVKYVKRALDIVVAIIAVIITAPINIVLVVITAFDVGFPLLFVHKRPGLGEKPIKIIKFRNMKNTVDENGKLLPAAERVTRWGTIARKTSLDELLQFWLILVGKMSVIGPRPLLMEYLPRYSLEQHMRHSVKPGLECPVMIEGLNMDIWEERFKNDVWYVKNVSFTTDCKMMVKLFRLVVNRKRANVRGEKIDKTFHGQNVKKK